jgi:hypothetical protein
MTIREEDLPRFQAMGDAEADADFAAIWATLDTTQRNAFMPTLGRWDPREASGALPPAVEQYVRRPLALPAWADRGALEAAQARYSETRRRNGARVVLGTYSLPVLYIHPEMSHTLATTSQLLLHVRRRYEDTQAFVEGVMTPGSLTDPAGNGPMWIRKIRLTHAFVRFATLTKWRPQCAGDDKIMLMRESGPVKNGMPLDQAEFAFVLQSFAWAIVDGLERMGWGMTAKEAADHVHAWSIIGSMLGVHEELLQGTSARPVDEARELFELLRDACLRGGDPLGRIPGDRADTWQAGRYLAAAWITFLVQVQRENTPEKYHALLYRFPRVEEGLQQISRIFIRRLCGEAAARQMRIGTVGWFDRFLCWASLFLIDPRDIAGQADAPEHVMSGQLLY